MTDTPLTVTVAKDLEDLIPVFMTNRNKEVARSPPATSSSSSSSGTA